jgi:GNAT superfamily N-acetyltransferase
VSKDWAQEKISPSRGLERLHRIASAAHWLSEKKAVEAVRILAGELQAPAPGRRVLARRLLRRLLTDTSPRVASEALFQLLPNESEQDVEPTLRQFVANQTESTNSEFYKGLAGEVFSPAQLRHLSQLAYWEGLKRDGFSPIGPWLLGFFGALGEQRPNAYPHFRQALAAWALLKPEPYGPMARDLLARQKEQYRSDLRSRAPRVSPDRVQMNPSVSLPLRNRIIELLTETVCVAEAVDILTGGVLSVGRLDEAPIQVDPAETRNAEEILRIEASLPGAPPFAFHLHVGSETDITWRLLASVPGPRGPLGYGVGGDWTSIGMWTGQIPTESTVEALLLDLEQDMQREDPRRKTSTWLNLAWTSLTGFFELWDRTGRTLQLAEPSPDVVAAPLHDYLEGTRLLSLGPLEPCDDLGKLMETHWGEFVQNVESTHADLTGTVTWQTVFSAFVEALGVNEALPLLAGLLELETGSEVPWREALGSFLETVQSEGFRPRRLSRAVTRYHRWIMRNPTASWVARASTLNEIYETYGLDDLEAEFPETRLRVFRETVFSEARPELGRELDALVHRSLRAGLRFEDLLGWITEVNRRLDLNDDETYFLARLAFGHLAPKEEAGWMVLDRGEGPKIGLVVARKDEQGRQIWIRPAARPAEIAQLHHFFTDSGLHVHFYPEHEYLLLADDNDNVLGGLYYRELSPEQLHLEKLVVGEAHRGRGLGGDLLEEFCRQAAARGYRFVTTGFFRPDYFARFGFRTERGMAGLVRRI